VGILLGLAAALLYGGGDFAGGMLSRRHGVLAVSLVGSIVSTAVVWTAMLISRPPVPGWHSLVWGLVSGLAGGAGELWLYRGLVRGRVSVVGPLSAVGAAIVPILLSILCGGHLPGWLPATGIVLGIPAIALVASSADEAPAGVRGESGVSDGLLAGAAFGLLFFGLARAGGHAGLWPVAGEQTGSLALLAVAALVARQPIVRTLRHCAGPALVGLAGMAATLLYYVATRSGELAGVVVVTSLYPAVTVILARLITAERFSRAQRAGLALSALTIVAIAIR
jgi:uncharacterized membrane protein